MVNSTPLRRMVSPTAQPPENSLVFASDPMTHTWARCCSSCPLKKRPASVSSFQMSWKTLRTPFTVQV